MQIVNAPVLRARLMGGYRFVLVLAFVGITLITGAAVVIQERHQYANEIASLHNRFVEKARVLDDTWRGYEEDIDAIRLKAEVFLGRNSLPNNSRLARWLLRKGPGQPFDLDELPPPYTVSQVGNLTGQINAFDQDFLREIETALYLNDRYGGVVYAMPEISALYYSSKRNFLNLYPWVPSSVYSYSPDPTNKGSLADRWPAMAPNVGPDTPYDQARRWLGVRREAPVGKLVLTIAQPVFDGGSFVGVVAADVTLEDLRSRLADWNDALGHFLILSDDDQVIIGNTDGLAAPLSEFDLGQPTSGPVVQDGYVVQVANVSDAPLRFVQLVSEHALYRKIAAGDLVVLVAGLGGLLLMLLVATWVTDRQLIRPSLRLLDFVQRESRGEDCEIPTVPRSWQPWFAAIRSAFESYSEMVGLQQELEVARSIQQSILPKTEFQRPEVTITWKIKPAKVVGGDFYDYFMLDNHRVGVVIADVSGKGVPGALFVAITRTLLRSEARQTLSPGQCLERVNAQLAEENETVTFVTVFYGILDLKTGSFVYANAGHLCPLLLEPSGAISELPQTGGIPLGMIEDARYGEEKLSPAPGSSIILFTDGITEAFDPSGNQFGDERLRQVFTIPPDDQERNLDTVFAAVSEFMDGAAQTDDWTCVMVRYEGDAATGDDRTEKGPFLELADGFHKSHPVSFMEQDNAAE